MLLPVLVRYVDGVCGLWKCPSSASTPGQLLAQLKGSGCGTVLAGTFRGNLPQPLWGHILPACASHPSVCGCFILKSLSHRVRCSHHSSSTFPSVYLLAHVGRQWHPAGDGHCCVRAALQAAETHLNPSKSGEKGCIWYLFLSHLKVKRKDFHHMNEGRVAVFCMTRLCASKTHSKWEKEICYFWQAAQPSYFLCLRKESK